MASPTTWSEFRVDLGELHNAIGVVRREHGQISIALQTIYFFFYEVNQNWETPSTVTFDNVRKWLTEASTEIEDLLSDMATRMQTAYDNYLHAEEVNARNLKGRDKQNQSHSGSRHGDGKHVGATLRSVAAQNAGDHGEKASKLREALAPVSYGNGATEGVLLRRYVPDAHID